MTFRRLANAIASVACLSLGTVLACGHNGDAPDPATPAAEGETAAASASASASGPSPGDAPSMDDVADDGSCAGANCLRRCDSKSRPGDCAAAGDALRSGADDVTKDATRAQKYLEKACGLKERNACAHLAEMFITGEGVAANVPRGLILLASACDFGSGDACADLARRSESGEGTKKDHAKAIAFTAQACLATEPQPTSCAALAEAADKKDKDAQKVIADWKKECKASKEAVACAGVTRLKKK